MQGNPYQAPSTDPYAVSPQYIGVEGDLLVIPSGAILPPFCVKTNQSVSKKDMVHRVYYWCPTWVFLVFGVIGHMIARKRCDVTFGWHPNQKKKQWVRRLILGSIPFFFFMLFLVFAVADLGPVFTFTPLFLFLISLLVFLISLTFSQLRPVKHQNGVFWMKGCCQEFLNQIVELQYRQQSGGTSPFGGAPPLHAPPPLLSGQPPFGGPPPLR